MLSQLNYGTVVSLKDNRTMPVSLHSSCRNVEKGAKTMVKENPKKIGLPPAAETRMAVHDNAVLTEHLSGAVDLVAIEI